jgi:hypothetical protein
MFLGGFKKQSGSLDKGDRKDVRNSAIAGTAGGAALYAGHDYMLDRREKKLPNRRTFSEFKKHLNPGDILISGGTPAKSDALWLSSKIPQKLWEMTPEIIKDRKITTISSMLSGAGAGSKYHAGIYLGKNRVGHMSGGAYNESLKAAFKNQNVAAYRFGDSTKKERESAVKYVRKVIKDKTPYSLAKAAPQVLTNLVSPIGRKANRKAKGSQVCNTLPSRAYNKRRFTWQGEHTYSGDLRKAKNLAPVARKDAFKLPIAYTARGRLGQAAKGIKFGLGAAAATYGYKKYKEHQGK